MVDSLWTHLERAVACCPGNDSAIRAGNYGLVTLHRPSNVDDEETLQEVARALAELSEVMPLLFPAHPRTQDRIKRSNLSFGATTITERWDTLSSWGSWPKLGWFYGLWRNPGRTTALGFRASRCETNRAPVTVKKGTNQLVGVSREGIVSSGLAAWKGNVAATVYPTLGRQGCRPHRGHHRVLAFQ